MEILFLIQSSMIPGTPIKDLFESAKNWAQKSGFATQYLGLQGLKSTFVGHGIGLELVEPPILARGRDQKLEPGMVFAVEPKFIFQDQFAAGIESVIQVTKKGGRFISTTPHKIFEV